MNLTQWIHDKIHFGYVILAAATIGKVFSAPGQSPCIGVVIDKVALSIDISSTTISSIYLAATITSAAVLPFTGILIKKWGVRISIGVIAFGLAFSCFLLSWSATNFHLYFSLFGLRFFGQGLMMQTSITTLNLWWVRSRGMMMGVAGAIVSGFLLGAVPLIMMALMNGRGDWRYCYRILGLTTLAFMMPIGLALFRGKPEHIGLLPDGRRGESEVVLDESESNEENFENNEEDDGNAAEGNVEPSKVLREPVFWVFGCADFITAATNTAFFFHLHRSMRDDMKFPDATVAAIYPIMAVVGITGRLLAGHLVDRYGCRLILIEGLVFMSFGFLFLPFTSSSTVFLAVIVLGLGGSQTHTTRSVVYATYFGRTSLPTIQPIATSLTVAGSAFGPFPFGLVHDKTGSFKWAFIGAALLQFFVALLVWVYGRRRSEGSDNSVQLGIYKTVSTEDDSDSDSDSDSDGDEDEDEESKR